MIFAYNEASVLAYHGRNRFVASIDFSSGASIVLADTTRKIYVIHGVAMFVAWGMIAPAGVFVMRFCRHKPYWLAAHKSLMSLTVSITVIAALAAVASSDQVPALPLHRPALVSPRVRLTENAYVVCCACPELDPAAPRCGLVSVGLLCAASFVGGCDQVLPQPHVSTRALCVRTCRVRPSVCCC